MNEKQKTHRQRYDTLLRRPAAYRRGFLRPGDIRRLVAEAAERGVISEALAEDAGLAPDLIGWEHDPFCRVYRRPSEGRIVQP